MEQDKPSGYLAAFGNLELRTWEDDRRYCWTVKKTGTHEQIAAGETGDLADAMVTAAEAAGAEWGAVKWHRGKFDEEEVTEPEP